MTTNEIIEVVATENTVMAEAQYPTEPAILVDEIGTYGEQRDEVTFRPDSQSLTITGAERQPLVLERGMGGYSDLIIDKFRAAEASVLFDPEAMELLGYLLEKKTAHFQELDEIIQTPEQWVKFALLVRAFFVEPLGTGVKVTTEATEAYKKLGEYLAKLDTENKGVEL